MVTTRIATVHKVAAKSVQYSSYWNYQECMHFHMDRVVDKRSLVVVHIATHIGFGLAFARALALLDE